MPVDFTRTTDLRAVRIAYRDTKNARSTGWWLTLVGRWAVLPDGPYRTRAQARRRRAALLARPEEAS